MFPRTATSKPTSPPLFSRPILISSVSYPKPIQTMSDYFPGDLHIQILKRLPLISIIKCRTVCKSWNSLITSHHFISTHNNFTNQNKTNTLFLRFFDRINKTEQYILGKDDQTFGSCFSNISFQYASTAAYFRIVGCYDGVVCLSDDLFGTLDMVILWNPSIRKSVQVLVSNYEKTWPIVTVLGFGVCPKTRDPKVIKIEYADDFSSTCLDVEVFSVESGLWRKAFGGNYNMIHVTWSQVCVNGFVHWIACEKQVESSFRCLVLLFDLVREMFDEMLLPDALACQDVSKLSISNRKGCLTMLEYDMEKGKESWGVWVMKEYGVMGSWEKIYVIRLPGMLRKAVGFRTNGDMVVALKNHELVYVECSGNIKSLGIYANIRSYFLGSYMESLILINQLDRQMYP